MLKKFVRLLGGDPNKRAIEKSTDVVENVNALEQEFEALSDEALRAKTAEFRARIAEQIDGFDEPKERQKVEQEALDENLPEAFAAVREASKRTIGLRHYDVQLIGGLALHQKKIAEMRTGEGKTLVATLPLYLNALTSRGVHLVTVNDYLARRDARWMAPIYNALGLSVGVLQMAARTENGKKAFLIDLEKTSPHEDQNQMRLVSRREAYVADITYGTNSEFGFDYLRDNMTMSLDERVQRGHYYAIVDEVDNVLIDEARTPLIISGPAAEATDTYFQMAQIVRQLRPEEYELNERDRNINLTELGEAHVEELLGTTLRDPDRPEDVTPEQARLLGHLEQAMRAQYLFKRNKDYLVQGGKVIIVDEFTGRLMYGRRWSDGLHQAVEAKEGVRVEAENVTYATITIQNYFRMYQKLAGMTGTALTEAEEFDKIYKLDVMAIPTNLEYQAFGNVAPLVEQEERDEEGYKYRIYIRRSDPEKKPIFYRRKDYPDVVYRTEEAKFRAIVAEIMRYHAMGRPMLVGTTSVELSDRLSNRLRSDPLRRLAQVLLLRNVWFEKNNREEDGRQVQELQWMNEPLDKLDTGELRKMARDLGISFNPEDASNLERLEFLLKIPATDRSRLVVLLQSGIPHQVLNARKHTEESQIIAEAGAFGGVTIATNMAGRGVDIKLGGELAEEIISAVNRVLRRAGHKDPYDMTLVERRKVLLALDPAEYGIYEAEVKFFLKHLDDMETVKRLGGLHVIGSERHEARRIDNQLRGRAARQGDPGSSRFYLSLGDELMRRFGGEQADNLMKRMNVDDALPMEIGIVSRLVEQSQTRVEGANFDVRKHLLEYDDVLNAQRMTIYTQRDLIFTKEDLTEDVTEMLRAEVKRHVEQSLENEEGPWKLLAWLEQIQPSLVFGNAIFPSYTIKILLEDMGGMRTGEDGQHAIVDARAALLGLAEKAFSAEQEHLLRTVQVLYEQSQDHLDEQIRERQETLDTFFEGLNLDGGEGAAPRGPREIQEELSSLLHLPIRFTPEEIRALREDPKSLAEKLGPQVEMMLTSQAVTRLIGAVERRLEELLGLNTSQLPMDDWEALAGKIDEAVEAVFQKRRERLLGPQGQIAKDLDSAVSRMNGQISPATLIRMMLMMPEGARSTFDRKSHRRVWQRTTRLTYIYYATTLLSNRSAEALMDDVLEHLEKAQETILLAIGPQALNSAYRQLLLGVITELWVDYLTQMEALRISIGLEAYGQRDPLVQYKSRASELFQELINNMRQGVVFRMFTYRPRMLSAEQAEEGAPEEDAPEAGLGALPEETSAETEAAQETPLAGGLTVQTSELADSRRKRRRRR